uniref:Putative enoyl-CoA hydratase n=1 Tax=Oryza sativa TaxID=4530 RepID=Q949E0_ORYSA|nr:putative enoyl-CoA hydratase [Oryza sativa]
MRRLLAASGRCAPATRTHHGLFARAIQILAPPDPVSLHKLSAPDCAPPSPDAAWVPIPRFALYLLGSRPGGIGDSAWRRRGPGTVERYKEVGIVELRLERPEVKNAINWEAMRLLRGVVEKVEADDTVKVVLVTSSVPGVFCAGADLKALSIPTIAVIEGAALGGGLELALSCDLRICGENATLGLPETGLAIIPGSRAKEMIFTGRRCNATEAVMMGLANYCVPAGEAHEKALELAREIAQKGPLGIRMAKKAIDQGMQAADMPSALAVEGECYEQLLHTEDRLEGLAAFAERRKPVYSGK